MVNYFLKLVPNINLHKTDNRTLTWIITGVFYFYFCCWNFNCYLCFLSQNFLMITKIPTVDILQNEFARVEFIKMSYMGQYCYRGPQCPSFLFSHGLFVLFCFLWLILVKKKLLLNNLCKSKAYMILYLIFKALYNFKVWMLQVPLAKIHCFPKASKMELFFHGCFCSLIKTLKRSKEQIRSFTTHSTIKMQNPATGIVCCVS